MVKPPPPAPPPPKLKEKEPEPEIKKQEKQEETESLEQPEEKQAAAAKDDSPPPGEELGVDSDGSGGSDAFGLMAKKGGRALISGSSGSGSGIGSGRGDNQTLLRKYSWYTQILQDEIRTKVNRYIEGKKDIPDGKHKILLRVELDDSGKMTDYTIEGSSGNSQVDEAVKLSMTGFKVSEAPPEGMPKIIKIKVTFKS